MEGRWRGRKVLLAMVLVIVLDVLTEFLPSFEAIAEGSKFPSATG